MAAFDFPNSPSTNDTYTANGITYTWNGTKWVRTSPSVGAQGATGPTGAQGATGATGAQGAQGATGSATISNNADDRVITGGSGTNLNGEANLTYDGTTLKIGGDSGVSGTWGLEVYNTDTSNNQGKAVFAGTQGAEIKLQDTVSGETVRIAANGQASFYSEKAGDPMVFYTKPSGGSDTERLRIKSTGEVHISDRNSSNTGDHFFQAGAFGIRMEDTGGYNRWNIERNYGGFQSTPLVHLSAQGRVGINTPNPSKLLTVHGGDLAVSEGRLHLSSDSDAAVPGSSFGYQVISGKKLENRT